nr:MAG TPA: peptidase [Microviridae sp.]
MKKNRHTSHRRKETTMKHVNYVKADYGRMSEHFKAKEFQCKDKSEYLLIATELIDTLEKIRSHFNAPVIINSGYRTPSWNSKVNGSPNSYHCKGMAADIVVKGRNSQEVAKYADSIMEQGGVIKYTNFVHVDVREEKYRKGV